MINNVLETEFLWYRGRWESNGRYLSECMCVTGVGRVWSIYSSLPWLLLPTTKFKKRSRSSFWPSASSSSRLSPQEGTGRLDAFLHSILSSTMCRSTTLPSSRTQPIHHFLGRPLLLVPGSLRFADHLTNSFSSILFTCPYYLTTCPYCILVSSLSVSPPPSIPALCLVSHSLSSCYSSDGS